MGNIVECQLQSMIRSMQHGRIYVPSHAMAALLSMAFVCRQACSTGDVTQMYSTWPCCGRPICNSRLEEAVQLTGEHRDVQLAALPACFRSFSRRGQQQDVTWIAAKCDACPGPLMDSSSSTASCSNMPMEIQQHSLQ